MKCFIFLILIHIVSVSQSSEIPKIKLLTANWPNYTEENGTGLYFEIIDKTIGLKKADIKLLPWKRAQMEFQKGHGDLLVGEASTNTNCFYPQWPIDADFFSLYYLKSNIKSEPTQTDLNIKYKVIGVRGYDLHGFAPEITQFEEVDDMPQGVQMILKKRADILIDYDEDLKEHLISKKLNPLENIVKPSQISGGYIYVCFKKNPAGEIAAKDFDANMNQLYKSGALKKIYLKYNREKNFQKVIQKKGLF